MRQTFEIPGRLDGLNEYTKANRAGAEVGNRMKADNEEIVMWAAKAARLKPMKAPVRFEFVWIESSMRRDKDNISFAKKFILDALKKLEIIGNDNWKWVESFTDTFRLNKTNPRIIVTMEEIDAQGC